MTIKFHLPVDAPNRLKTGDPSDSSQGVDRRTAQGQTAGDAIESDAGPGQHSVKFFEILDAKTGPGPRMLLAGNRFAGDHCRQRL